MGRDLLLSIVLHTVIVAVTIFAAPLDIRKPNEMADVIRVGVVSMPEAPSVPVEAVPEPVTPQPLVAAPDEVVLDDPTTKPAAEIEEPKEDPKPDPPEEEKPKPKPQPTATQPATADRDQAGTDDGQAEVDAPAGGAIAGAQVSNSDFTYPYWFTLAFNKINQNYRMPFAVDGKIQCRVYFEVIKSGRVIEMRVESPSGLDQFDDACLAAIGRAAPFPPLPKKFLPEIIGLTITFSNVY